MKKLRIALTGATGLLGRNLLFEIIKQNLGNLDDLEILILGRSQGNFSIKQRVMNIVKRDGFLYLGLDKTKEKKVLTFCEERIVGVGVDLDKPKIDISKEDFKRLKSSKIDFFFHIAAITDFRKSADVIDALYRTNVDGTRQILELVSTLSVEEFCYVGSAYSCGKVSGNIPPDIINLSQEFRNPYEKSKLEGELLTRGFEKKNKVKCRYFRPSTICGRLIEEPLGSINKFDVFYSWARGFLHMKLKKLGEWKDKYQDAVNLDIRICYNTKSGLNIVPADYAAKVMYQVCIQKNAGSSYYLVNDQETPHSVYIPIMLDMLNIQGTKVVDRMPEEKNRFEKLYYKTIGSIFTPYIESKPMLFNAKNIRPILEATKLSCPAVNKDAFKLLMKFAKKHDFEMSEG